MKWYSQALQEVAHLSEVGAADAPGSVHEKNQICLCASTAFKRLPGGYSWVPSIWTEMTGCHDKAFKDRKDKDLSVCACFQVYIAVSDMYLLTFCNLLCSHAKLLLHPFCTMMCVDVYSMCVFLHSEYVSPCVFYWEEGGDKFEAWGPTGSLITTWTVSLTLFST